MADRITQTLEEFETLVRDGKTATFWVAVRKDGLWFEVPEKELNQKVPLAADMFDSLATFFYGVSRIEYNSHDYDNLKSFINARAMLDRLLNNKEAR
ncbi:hypothetical protein [Pontibacter russatus]|uniref:hypothetical protein n=1 Tax=Pontibacter russatus TaxID=2694929 RepID=UPI00137B10BE|nr:hypothetical protein [Pontibacter russatus]